MIMSGAGAPHRTAPDHSVLEVPLTDISRHNRAGRVALSTKLCAIRVHVRLVQQASAI